MVKPHKDVKVSKTGAIRIIEGNDGEQLSKLIKIGDPFEHLVIGASSAYKNRRIEIASKAYLK